MFLGGHQESEITCLAYCEKTRLIASGAKNGTVCLWNCNSNKLEHFFFDHPNSVIGLSFLFPFPLLFICSEDGYMTLWEINVSHKFTHRNTCIMRLINYNVEDGEYFDKSKLDPVSSFHCLHHFGTPILHQRIQDKTPRSPANIIPRSNRNIQNTELNNNPRKSVFRDSDQITFASGPFKTMVRDHLKSPNILFESKFTASDFSSFFKLKMIQNQLEKNYHYYISIGTRNGSLLVFDLMPYIQMMKIKPYTQSQLKDITSRNSIRREENLCVDRVLEKEMAFYVGNIQKITDIYNLSSTLLLLRLSSIHETSILSIDYIHSTHPHVYMTSSMESIVVHTCGGDMKGKIHISTSRDSMWEVQLDWVRGLEREYEIVAGVMEEIDGERPSKQTVQQEMKKDIVSYVKRERQSEADEEMQMRKKPPASVLRMVSQVENRLKTIKKKDEEKKDNHHSANSQSMQLVKNGYSNTPLDSGWEGNGNQRTERMVYKKKASHVSSLSQLSMKILRQFDYIDTHKSGSILPFTVNKNSSSTINSLNDRHVSESVSKRGDKSQASAYRIVRHSKAQRNGVSSISYVQQRRYNV